MTTIKATCPTCGEVALTPDDIELRVDQGDTGSFYGFSCPRCRAEVRKPADERVVRLLVSGGVPALPLEEEGPAPVRLRDRFDHPGLTHDDLLDFHQMLEDDAWYEALLGTVR